MGVSETFNENKLGMSFDLLNIILFPRPFAFIHTSSDLFINLLILLFFSLMSVVLASDEWRKAVQNGH